MTDQTGFELVCTATEIVGLSADAQEIVVTPAGSVETSDGETFVMDADAAGLIGAAFRQQAVDLVIDYEHSTLAKGEQGERADAAGWITALRFDGHRGLIASTRWTADARDAIAAGKYRYISPVLAIRRDDRRAVALHSAGLTNKPAIRGAPALLAASEKLAGFLKALSQDPPPAGGADTSGEPIDGGGDGPNPGPAQAAADPKTAGLVRQLLAKLRDLLGLDETATMRDVLAAIDEFIEASAEQETDTAAMRERIRAELEQERELEDLLVQCSHQNKLHLRNESMVRAARTLAAHDLESFKVFMGHLPSAVPPGRTTPPTQQQTETQVIARQAAAEFQAHRAELSRWTDQDAFVAMRLRERGLKAS